MPRILYLFLLLAIVVSAGCEDEAEVPAYIRVEAPIYAIRPENGSDFHALTEHYVRHNGQQLGAISLGDRLPVLADGPDEIVTFGGVRQNGISSLPSIYFPFRSDTFRADFVPGEEYTFTPTYRYIDNTVFHFIEDFEGGQVFTLDLDGNASTVVTNAAGEGFGGSTAGRLSVTEDDPVLTAASADGYTEFSDIGDIYVEMTYRNDVQMAVGLLSVDPNTGRSEEISGLFLFPQDTLSKVYIELSTPIRRASFEQIHVVVSIRHDGRDGPAEAYIDDVKFLYLR